MAQWVEHSHAEDRVFESLPVQTLVVDQVATVPRKTLAYGLCFPYKRMSRVIFGATVKAPSVRNCHLIAARLRLILHFLTRQQLCCSLIVGENNYVSNGRQHTGKLHCHNESHLHK